MCRSFRCRSSSDTWSDCSTAAMWWRSGTGTRPPAHSHRHTGRSRSALRPRGAPTRPVLGRAAPELGGRRDPYFHFYVESVRWAIAAGREGLLLGKKMAEMKQTLGATLIPQYAAAIPLR